MNIRLFLALAAGFGFLAVAIGAFGAHALKSRLAPDMLEVYHTGVLYQMFHTLALVAVAILIRFFPQIGLYNLAGWFFTAGIILFSGSLYILSISGIKMLGAITPIGGLCFLAGWALLFVGALKSI